MKKIILSLAFITIGLTSAFAQIQPDAKRTEDYRKKGPCSDPWISWAHIDASAGTDSAQGYGTYGQCNPKWYNNGSWSNYTELFNAVREYRNSLSQAGIAYKTKFNTDGSAVFYATIDGQAYGTVVKGLRKGTGGKVFDLIGNDSGGLVGNDGASLVAAGGGNLVAAGGGNLVAAGGGNFSLQAGEKKRIKVGKNTYLVIKK